MKATWTKWGLLSLLGCAILSGGCGVSKLPQNIWVGFGESVGSLSANILIDYINSTFTDEIIGPPPSESE
ncbi:MAG: hypothetical protein JXB13_19480 [Phycisphaerae bacterium]|nr:hypothetical protein [Phycisphaerae bacterium]